MGSFQGDDVRWSITSLGTGTAIKKEKKGDIFISRLNIVGDFPISRAKKQSIPSLNTWR